VHTPEQRRTLREARVREGRAHAALVYVGAKCVGGVSTDLPKSRRASSTRRLIGGARTNYLTGALRASSSAERLSVRSMFDPAMVPSHDMVR
jgi:hypothetical protein